MAEEAVVTRRPPELILRDEAGFATIRIMLARGRAARLSQPHAHATEVLAMQPENGDMRKAIRIKHFRSTARAPKNGDMRKSLYHKDMTPFPCSGPPRAVCAVR
jgi:hypothetical protein